MQCPLCGVYNTHKHGKTKKGTQRYLCPSCKQTFTDNFDTIYYRRKISPQKIETVLQAHAEGSSLRGISRTTKLAYNTVISVVRYAAQGKWFTTKKFKKSKPKQLLAMNFGLM